MRWKYLKGGRGAFPRRAPREYRFPLGAALVGPREGVVDVHGQDLGGRHVAARHGAPVGALVVGHLVHVHRELVALEVPGAPALVRARGPLAAVLLRATRADAVVIIVSDICAARGARAAVLGARQRALARRVVRGAKAKVVVVARRRAREGPPRVPELVRAVRVLVLAADAAHRAPHLRRRKPRLEEPPSTRSHSSTTSRNHRRHASSKAAPRRAPRNHRRKSKRAAPRRAPRLHPATRDLLVHLVPVAGKSKLVAV